MTHFGKLDEIAPNGDLDAIKRQLWEQFNADEVVNLYWQKHYRYYKDGSCKICWGNGVFDTDPSTGTGPHYCICPEGMKRRKESEGLGTT